MGLQAASEKNRNQKKDKDWGRNWSLIGFHDYLFDSSSMMGSEYFGNASVTGGHEIPGKNLITPDRRDIPVPPMLEAGLDLQQAPPIDSGHQ
jgi:hypothetical protein